MLLGQQRRFALHASVVDLDGVRLAIAGASTAGKSTTTLALASRGGTLIADDLAVLAVEGGQVTVEPFGRSVHVWPETAGLLGIDRTGAGVVSAGAWKLAFPVADHGVTTVHGLVVLLPGGDLAVDDPVRHERLRSPTVLTTLSEQTYRPHTVRQLWPAEAFEWHAQLASAIPVHRLTRPPRRWSLDEVLTHVHRIRDDLAAP